MKLIHHGKILKDDQVLNSIGLKAKDFVVVMTKSRKKKKQKAPVTAQQTQNQDQAPPAQNQQQTAQTTEQPAQTGAQTAQTGQTQQQGNNTGASALVTGNQMEETIANLMAMGFPRSECVAALRAAFNNPDRAVEYLLTGIPANVVGVGQQQQANPAQAPPQQSQGAPAMSQGGPAQAMGQGAPQSAQLLTQLLQNPAMLNAVLQEISTIRPEAYQQIVQNMQANPQTAVQQFATLLNDPQVLQMFMQRMLMGGFGGQGGLPGMQQGANPGQRVVQLTAEEAESIQRLRNM